MKRTWTALILTVAMICTMGIQSLAVSADSQEGTSIVGEPTVLPDSVLYQGQIKQIDKDESGVVTRLVLDSDSYGPYVMNISPETVWIDSRTKTADDPSDLAVGESLSVFHSIISTRSLPPQSAAFAVVRNIPQDADSAMFQVVGSVTSKPDGGLSILTNDGGLIISVDQNTGVSSYLAGVEPTLNDLKKGTRIMAWYSIVLTSYPGQTYASHVILLPDPAPNGAQPQEGEALTVVLDGKAIDIAGRYENGVAMVPVAAVAKALGYQVTYTPGAEGALVTVESDTFAVHLEVAQKLIYGVTKIEGAVGMTGPQNYGKDAYIEAPGTTWAPAQLFALLGKTATLNGSCLTIE